MRVRSRIFSPTGLKLQLRRFHQPLPREQKLRQWQTEIRTKIDDQIREVFRKDVAVGGAAAAVMVEEVVNARREIWGGQTGGECISAKDWSSLEHESLLLPVTVLADVED